MVTATSQATVVVSKESGFASVEVDRTQDTGKLDSLVDSEFMICQISERRSLLSSSPMS